MAASSGSVSGSPPRTAPAPTPPAPGAKPTLPGFYLPYSLPAGELALLLEAHANRPPPPPPPRAPGRALRWLLAAAVFGLGAAGCAVDQRLGFGAGVFATFQPLAWTGAALVLAAGRRPTFWPGLKKMGCALLLCGGPLGFLALVYLNEPSLAGWAVPGAIAGALLAVFGFTLDRRDRPPRPHEPPRDVLAKCAAVVSALADDAQPDKPATGWIDLTGAEQPGKLLRQAKAANGAEVRLYRDEWWRLRLPLADGNQLRLAAVRRRKSRGQYWKKGARRRKLKPGRVEELTTWEARLAVNPAAWRIKPADGQARRLDGISLSPVAVGEGSVSVVGQPATAGWFEPPKVLALLAALYGQLERAAPGA